MIHIRLYTIRMPSPFQIKIMRYKLSGTAVFFYNIRLPSQKIVYQHPLKFLELCSKTAINRPSYIWKILPCVNAVTPIIQPKCRIHNIQIVMELLSEVFYKLLLHIPAGCSIVLCLIIYLKTNDTFPLRRMLRNPADDTLCIISEHWMRNIHNLSGTIMRPAVFSFPPAHPGRISPSM